MSLLLAFPAGGLCGLVNAAAIGVGYLVQTGEFSGGLFERPGVFVADLAGTGFFAFIAVIVGTLIWGSALIAIRAATLGLINLLYPQKRRAKS